MLRYCSSPGSASTSWKIAHTAALPPAPPAVPVPTASGDSDAAGGAAAGGGACSSASTCAATEACYKVEGGRGRGAATHLCRVGWRLPRPKEGSLVQREQQRVAGEAPRRRRRGQAAQERLDEVLERLGGREGGECEVEQRRAARRRLAARVARELAHELDEDLVAEGRLRQADLHGWRAGGRVSK